MYSRRSCVRISGVPEERDKSDDVVLEIDFKVPTQQVRNLKADQVKSLRE